MRLLDLVIQLIEYEGINWMGIYKENERLCRKLRTVQISA
ncbi:hypothetical protein HMPREF1620_03473 [Escherichia coli 909945-2]|nr:hypothetical protein HMPREF1620_03473 [Escherichia coli 909945-2]